MKRKRLNESIWRRNIHWISVMSHNANLYSDQCDACRKSVLTKFVINSHIFFTHTAIFDILLSIFIMCFELDTIHSTVSNFCTAHTMQNLYTSNSLWNSILSSPFCTFYFYLSFFIFLHILFWHFSDPKIFLDFLVLCTLKISLSSVGAQWSIVIRLAGSTLQNTTSGHR